MAVDARFRREWRKKNPILRMNDIGIDLNDGSQKLGDGKTRWNDLAYLSTVKPAAVLGEGAVPTELVEAVAALNETIVTKQDVTTATTDTELANAVANLNSLLAGKQDTGTAATDAELLSAVNTLNASLANKQDASTAATDLELGQHAADTLLHSSGKELAYVENVSGVLQPVNSTVLADVTGMTITVPPQTRPYWVRGEAMLDVSTAPAAAATGQMQLIIVDDVGTGLAAWEGCIEGGAGTSGQFTGKLDARIEAGAPQKTYRMQVSRGSTSFAFDVKQGSGSPVFKSWLSAISA